MENKAISQDLLICPACGTQFDQPASDPLRSCRICDDPRQYIPPAGQRWTSLGQELSKTGPEAHENHIIPLTININSDSTLDTPTLATQDGQASITRDVPNAYTVYTKPTLGIGERAILLVTPHGTIMWDLITYLDDSTIAKLNAPPFNGLKAIVISHPHYYTTHLDWAEAFDCPVYISEEDAGWNSREDVRGRRRLIKGSTEEIVPGLTAVKVGGHFPGSLVLHWKKMLLIADSIVTMPSALYHINRPPGTTSYSYMWSIPNMIPLPPSTLVQMWEALRPFDFHQTHGAFVGQDVYDPNVKDRVRESMRIQIRGALEEGGEKALDRLS